MDSKVKDDLDLALAKLFHELYEKLAPKYGYEIKKETKEFDPETPNGKLMVAVCKEINVQIQRSVHKAYVLGMSDVCAIVNKARESEDGSSDSQSNPFPSEPEDREPSSNDLPG